MLRGAALAFVLPLVACAPRPSPQTPVDVTAPFCLVLTTDLGAVRLRIFPDAAPTAVAAIRAAIARFDGAPIAHAHPRTELRLAPAAGSSDDPLPAELDAAALGLDRIRVADRGEAMNLLQHELLPALTRPNAERRATPTLEAWGSRFARDHDPSFLVGATRQEILEAIGYEFTAGPESRPALRGAVALVPRSPSEASLTIALLLRELPGRTGRWVVIGEVVSGLELADEISLRPLAEPERRDYRPLQPITIRRAGLEAVCAGAAGEGTP